MVYSEVIETQSSYMLVLENGLSSLWMGKRLLKMTKEKHNHSP